MYRRGFVPVSNRNTSRFVWSSARFDGANTMGLMVWITSRFIVCTRLVQCRDRVHVIATDALPEDSRITRPMIVVHIVDSSTGRYLRRTPTPKVKHVPHTRSNKQQILCLVTPGAFAEPWEALRFLVGTYALVSLPVIRRGLLTTRCRRTSDYYSSIMHI